MSTSLFLTRVDHCRVGKTHHRFRYLSLSCLVELTALGADRLPPFLSYNRFNLFGLRDKDFFPGQTGSILERLRKHLMRFGVESNWDRVEMLTSPRFFGYVFNPVTFFLCYAKDADAPALCVAQVNNTFGETHVYIAEPDIQNARRRVKRFHTKKEFHVSPFYDRGGDYTFCVERTTTGIDIRVNLVRDGNVVFTSSTAGEFGAAEPLGLAKALAWGLRYSWLTLPRIVWQAAVLRYQKKLPVFRKPIAQSPATIGKRNSSWFERLCQKFLCRYLRALRKGELLVDLPSGETLRFGVPETDFNAHMVIHDWSFFPRVLFGGDVAFGECYMDKVWSSDSLTSVPQLFAENAQFLRDRDIPFTKFVQRLNAFIHRRRANSKRGSRKNIPAHYDLGNELFRRFFGREDGLLMCGISQAKRIAGASANE